MSAWDDDEDVVRDGRQLMENEGLPYGWHHTGLVLWERKPGKPGPDRFERDSRDFYTVVRTTVRPAAEHPNYRYGDEADGVPV